MLFSQDDAPAVKQWLIRELEPMCVKFRYVC